MNSQTHEALRREQEAADQEASRKAEAAAEAAAAAVTVTRQDVERIAEDYILDYYRGDEDAIVLHYDVIEETVKEIFTYHTVGDFTGPDDPDLIQLVQEETDSGLIQKMRLAGDW